MQGDHDWFLSLLDDEKQKTYEDEHIEAVMQLLRIVRIRTHKNAIKEMQNECPGWVCKVDNEIDSIYKSMGVRVGVQAKF